MAATVGEDCHSLGHSLGHPSGYPLVHPLALHSSVAGKRARRVPGFAGVSRAPNPGLAKRRVNNAILTGQRAGMTERRGASGGGAPRLEHNHRLAAGVMPHQVVEPAALACRPAFEVGEHHGCRVIVKQVFDHIDRAHVSGVTDRCVTADA